MAPKKPPRPAVGEVFAMPLRRGWGACQVVGRAAKSDVVVGLDHWSEAPPALADVALRPLYIDHHFWSRTLHRMHVSGPVPASFVALGAAPCAVTDEPSSVSYGGWMNLPLHAALQLQWNALPPGPRDAFRLARESRQPVTVRLPGGDATVALGENELSLDLTRHRGPYDFTALDALPALMKLDVTGAAPGLVAWLATRPLVETLTWRGELPDELDLRATSLRSCELVADGDRAVTLPTDLELLTLAPSATARWRVRAHDDGALLTLSLRTRRGDGIDRVDGVDRVWRLSVHGFTELDLRTITARFHPRSLELFGAPGDVRHADALASLSALETLTLWRCFRVDADHMPALSQWPSLHRAEVVEAVVAEGAALKANWGRDRRVSVRSPLPDAWPRHHTGHPFLEWHNAHRGGLAGAAFATASMKLVTAGGDETAVRRVMRGFVMALQRVHERDGAFTPDESRDIESAWSLLLARVTPTFYAAVTDPWLASWRKGW